MQAEVREIIKENERRHAFNSAPFNPITGLGSIGERVALTLSDYPDTLYLPKPMMRLPFIKHLIKAGSIKTFVENGLKEVYSAVSREKVIEQLVRVRIKHDFPFWAAYTAYIKKKGGGGDVLFWLNRPQRRLIERLERMRLSSKPIRLILLKARQWGGSTAIQIYMAWLQLVHEVGLNSLVVAQVSSAASKVRGMFSKLISRYPTSLLYEMGQAYSESEEKFVNHEGLESTKRIPQRACTISIGTAEKPDNIRGDDYSLVHCTEVGLWRKTEGKSPEDIVQSATSGVPYTPMTMIVYESTAKGTGNFFHREYEDAKRGESQFEAFFIAWFDIDLYTLPFDSDTKRNEFAEWLWTHRNAEEAISMRQESGRYYWWLWNKGATLEAIHWYTKERAKYREHSKMASEYPSDDVEAFAHSGERIFDKYKVEALRQSCRAPRYRGELQGRGVRGDDCLRDLCFASDEQGRLSIWSHPEYYDGERVLNRYLVVVDIGGRSERSDYSVIAVFDRMFMIDGGRPSIVAQWYGHIDMDLLAWKAVQVAKYYDNALLVIESNTADSRDGHTEGDQSTYLLSIIRTVYDNLYARKQSEDEIRERAPLKYGFHVGRHNKPTLISSLQRAIRDAEYVERDEKCLDEYLTYERKDSGSWGAIDGKHDDILMTRAIGIHICFAEMPLPVIQKMTAPRRSSRRAVSAASM